MKMQYSQIAQIRKPAARYAMGGMLWTVRDNVDGEVLAKKTKAESFRLLDDAFELGYTTFDTARVYADGESELCMGEWMRSAGVREQVFIIGKGATMGRHFKTCSPELIIRDIFETCDRLRCDYIDLYMPHRDNPDIPMGEIVDVLAEMQRKGYIHGYGGSNWQASRTMQAQEYAREKGYPPLAAMQPGYSLAVPVVPNWNETDEYLSAPECKPNYDYYQTTQMPIFTWSSMGRGFWSGRFNRESFTRLKDETDPVCVKAFCHETNFQRMDRAELLAARMGISVPNIALAYLLSRPLNIFPIIGCASREELLSNLEALEIRLDAPTCAWLNLESDEQPW